MKRAVILVLFLIIGSAAAGCLSPAGVVAPIRSNPPPLSGQQASGSGGTAVAVAFDRSTITTASPVAEELFLDGLGCMSRPGGYNDSLFFFDNALAIDPDFSGAWTARGAALQNLGRYDEAVASYDHALELSPSNPSVWQLKCTALRDAGRENEAAFCRQEAAGCYPPRAG